MQLKISGTVYCDQSSEIEPGSVVALKVFDGAMGCGPMRVAGSHSYEGVTSLPFDFEFEYSDELFADRLNFGPAISCQITNGDKLLFINDTRFMLWDHTENKLMDHIRFPLIKINPSS